VLVDTDVMIWALRGHARADQRLLGLDGFVVSSVAYMELLQGLEDQAALRLLKKTMRDWQVRILYVNEAIATRAVLLMESRGLSHGMQMADAIIAATALESGDTLLSGNGKHFKGIDGLQLEVFKP
jgi:predicted nucleic acid-binding protein